MVTLVHSAAATTACSASGDATLRLIANGDVAAIDPATIPGFGDVAPFLQNAPHYVVDGKHYGMPHGWGGNTLLYRTDMVSPAPTSWDVVFDPTAAQPYAGKITAYDSPIYIADAALYLKAHKPELGITDPYELTQPQFDAAVELLKQQRPWVGKYWSAFADEIDNFTNGTTVVGTTWPYQYNTLAASGVPGRARSCPSEGMTGWADTWMLTTKAEHPNCMLKWMAWMLTPEVQAQVAEYFGEAPANPKACKYLDAGYGSYKLADFCTAYGVNDPSFYNSHRVLEDPAAGLRRRAAPTRASTTPSGPRSGRRSRAEPGSRRVERAAGHRSPRSPGVAMTPARPSARRRTACGGASTGSSTATGRSRCCCS